MGSSSKMCTGRETLMLKGNTIVCAADLIQLAGMKSIEAAGGPHIPFTPGNRLSALGLS